MEERPESGFWNSLRRIFSGHDEQTVEETILEAREDGELNVREVAMLLNVLRLGRKKAYEIMIPRTDIVCADIDDGIDGVSGLIFRSGHSRIPVYKDSKDEIVGIVHAKDLLKALYTSADTMPDLVSILRPPPFIPENKSVMEVMQFFQNERKHLAIAQDEYGGTSGLITFEDVLEEIVGEIEDEYDTPRASLVRPSSRGGFHLSGRARLDDLIEHIPVEFGDTETETIGGYLCELAGKVPARGEVFGIGNWIFRIREADARHVISLNAYKKEERSPDQPDSGDTPTRGS